MRGLPGDGDFIMSDSLKGDDDLVEDIIQLSKHRPSDRRDANKKIWLIHRKAKLLKDRMGSS